MTIEDGLSNWTTAGGKRLDGDHATLLCRKVMVTGWHLENSEHKRAILQDDATQSHWMKNA